MKPVKISGRKDSALESNYARGQRIKKENKAGITFQILVFS
jgi:hypothetical protein